VNALVICANPAARYCDGPQCSRSVAVTLRWPTDDTLALTKAAVDGMRRMS
jgi:DNA polymerase V